MSEVVKSDVPKRYLFLKKKQPKTIQKDQELRKSSLFFQEEAQKGHFDLLWHVGDMGYNLDTDDATYGDAFFRQMEPVAAYVPYQGWRERERKGRERERDREREKERE